MAELLNVASWPLWAVVGAFIAAAALIFAVGPRMARVAEQLAVVTGMGQAVTGALLLGLSTSLSGTIVSITAAARGDAELALSNGLGGIAVQTAFLAVADFFHKGSNLEHAAASHANVFQMGLLLTLLSATLLAFVGPDVTLWRMHPVSYALPIAWLAGMLITRRVIERPGWRPAMTRETQGDDDEQHDASEQLPRQRSLWLAFAGCAVAVTAAGFALSITAPRIATATGMSTSAVGALLTATITSLPELVTTVAAVRRGALTLAVGDIIGGNAFDTLFSAAADFAYAPGSIYHAVTQREHFVTALGILLSAILLMGLVGREPKGPAKIGWESLLILILYAAGAVSLVLMGP